jgi:protein phosphatase
MSKIKISLAAWSDAAGRPMNEDSFLLCRDLDKQQWLFETNETVSLGRFGSLITVCDGMGGMNAGEVASALAVDAVKAWFSRDRLTNEIATNTTVARRFLAEAITTADRHIKQEAASNAEKAGMGSTIVLAWLIGDSVHIGWCGDSRAYRFNPATGLERLSHDHSYVQELVDAGCLQPDLARLHPNSNIITRSLGDSGKDVQPDIATFTLCRGDTLLICTDGLHGVLDDSEIEATIKNNCRDMRICRDALLKASQEAGWTDNVTLALCHVVSGGAKPTGRPLMSETVKQADKGLLKKLQESKRVNKQSKILLVIRRFVKNRLFL